MTNASLPAVKDSPAVEIANPATGELIRLSDPTDTLAQALDEVRDMESRQREFKARISEEILRRMDAEGVWTAEVGEFKVSGQSPDRTDYDADKLLFALDRLVADGDITPDARDRAVTVVESLKVSKRGVQALRKLGGRVEEVINDTEVAVETPRRISVRRNNV